MTPGTAALGCSTGKKKNKSLAISNHTAPPQCKDLQKGRAALKNATVVGFSLFITDQRLKLIIKTKAITEMSRFREKAKTLGSLPL